MLCLLVSLGIHLHPWPLQSISELKQIWHRSAVKEFRNHSIRRIKCPWEGIARKKVGGLMVHQGLVEEAEAYGWESLILPSLLFPLRSCHPPLPWGDRTFHPSMKKRYFTFLLLSRKKREVGKEPSPIAERQTQEPRRKPYFYSCYFKAPHLWRKGSGCSHTLTSPAAVALWPYKAMPFGGGDWLSPAASHWLKAGTLSPCKGPLFVLPQNRK